MKPTNRPLVANLRQMKAAHEADTPKPIALGTVMRNSGTLGCARQAAYNWHEVPASNPVSGPNALVMRNGTMVGEDFANLAKEVYPNSLAEETSGAGDVTSGAVDIFIPEADLKAYDPSWNKGNAVVEIKTMGRWNFDSQIGVNSTKRQILPKGQGPKLGAILQAGINALGLEGKLGVTINTLILVSETFENLSIQKCNDMGIDLNDYTRMSAEWHFDRDYWEPLTQSELLRMKAVADEIEYGYLPGRIAGDDNGNLKELDPSAGKDWNCWYCSHKGTCIKDGRGSIAILDSLVPTLKEQA
jgi:hypothetical protein